MRDKKITVMLPKDLIERALKSSGEGLTSTLRKGLELIAAKSAYKSLLKIKGKYKNSDFDLADSREDRDL